MSVPAPEALRGELLLNEPMARHTSWHVGGPADRFYRPADIDDLAAFLQTLPEGEPVHWVGLGSNLLVRDGGIRGVVICTQGMLNAIERVADGVVRVEAGVSCAKVARYGAQVGLVGAEFLAGIPGTMGGALAMNAGAFGGETWSLVQAVETIDARGALRTRSRAEYRPGYRQVLGPAAHEWYVAAHLRLSEGDGAGSRDRIKAHLAQRNTSQPIGEHSCGSVFRNPPGDYAARLIEAAGLKGHCIGGASVSIKHANFIVNDGSASAADIEALIGHVAETVERRWGVTLTPEVRIVGEPGVGVTSQRGDAAGAGSAQ